MTAPVEVEINAPTVEVEAPAPSSDAPSTVDLNHESRITALEMTVAGLVEAQASTAVTAEVALEVASDAQQTAVDAIDTAVDAEIVAESVAEAVEEIAETTETQEDDEIVAETIVVPDVPARRPNFMFDDKPFDRFKR